MSEATRLLETIDRGDPNAAERLLPLVYGELRRLAAAKMASQPSGHTLQPTALVHEAYLRLVGDDSQWRNSRHFFACAAESMRRILIDAARKKRRLKRGGDWQRLELEDLHLAVESDPETLLTVNEALDAFAREDPDKAELVKLRFFGEMPLPRAAHTLGISLATAKRHWAFSRAWLFRFITNSKKV